VHTVHRDGRWVNEVGGGERASSTHDTENEAVKAGRELARNRKTEHVIHNVDGKISERNSYGNDPAHAPGSSQNHRHISGVRSGRHGKPSHARPKTTPGRRSRGAAPG
jgi:hypothetical protein